MKRLRIVLAALILPLSGGILSCGGHLVESDPEVTGTQPAPESAGSPVEQGTEQMWATGSQIRVQAVRTRDRWEAVENATFQERTYNGTSQIAT